ncbi:transcriptional regulator [Paenibacillus sp. GCM10027626]|uniref:transcriptional regulator n=1 Tax=Paenibacillus sp. GCM10027626 TaxID=3273411 RepID=UPI00363661DE
MDKLKDYPLWAIILFIVVYVILAVAQSTWLFIDARKHGRFPWFWGIWGLIHIPMPTIVYLLWSMLDRTRKKKRG